MGYFTRLQKRARNESGWSGYMYTGSASAGADLVSEDTWCVVYGADVVYESELERISSLSLSTNFVNPLSSGNPCTVGCYLYTSDPTQGGSFDVSAPPAGYIASAYDSFEAGTVGSYRTFSFPGLDMRPGRVWFWFTSTVSYESYGSNRIYHYATGNYSAALDTGTRTPAIYGSFVGGGSGSSGGTDSGGEYTAVASGSYSGIFARCDFSLSRSWHSASYTALSFTGSGRAAFSCEHGGGGDSFLQLRAYLSRGSGFDKASGTPTDGVLMVLSGADSYSFEYDVVSGQTYYLWTVIDYCGTDPVPLNISIVPGSWSYTLSDKGSSTNIAQTAHSFSMSMSAFQTGRMTLSFAYSGYVDISVGEAENAFSAMIYVSEQGNIDNATGRPIEYIQSVYMGSMTSIPIERGKNYYFFAVYNGGSEAGTVSFTISPPELIWTQHGSNSYSLIETAVSTSISLGVEQYHYIKLSTAYSGLIRLKGSNIQAGSGVLGVYVSEKDCFDSRFGYPTDTLSYLWLYEEQEAMVDLIAGKDYYLYVLNTAPPQSLSANLSLTPPSAPDIYREELRRNNTVEGSSISGQHVRRYSYDLNTLKFRYRGQARLSLAKAASETDSTVHLRAYLCSESGIDTATGIPTGTVLASYTGGGESFGFDIEVEEERQYYLYTVCDEIYGSYTTDVELSLISPPVRYFSVTESGEYLGLSEAAEYSAAPGESGVLRLELSFMSGGIAELSTEAVSGTDYLMGWLSLSPYLDGYTGAPVQNILKSAAGSSEAPGLKMKFPVRALTSYYLFIRGSGLYHKAQFDISLRQSPAAVGLYTQGKCIRAQPCLYHNGQWHAVIALCHKDGAWAGCG